MKTRKQKREEALRRIEYRELNPITPGHDKREKKNPRTQLQLAQEKKNLLRKIRGDHNG